jgi:hypothetical protein
MRVEVGVKNEKAERELESNLPPSFAFFFFSMVFFSLCFFSFLLLEQNKMLGESGWNKSAKAGRQKWEPKVRAQNRSLKVSSLLSLWFFFSLCSFSLLLL